MSKIGTGVVCVLSGSTLGLLSGINLEAYSKAKVASGTKNNIEVVIKSDIKSTKFDSITKSIDGMPWGDQPVAWQKAADNIRLKSAVDSAYHKGAQMVRDSIAAAKAVK